MSILEPVGLAVGVAVGSSVGAAVGTRFLASNSVARSSVAALELVSAIILCALLISITAP